MKKVLAVCLLLGLPFCLFSAETRPSNSRAKIRIAVLNFESKARGLDTAALGDVFRSALLQHGSKNFVLVERDKLNLILEEENLELAGITESEATGVGQKAGADLVLTGTISKLNEQYVVTVRAIDVKSGTSSYADKVTSYFEEELVDAVSVMAERFVKKSRGDAFLPEFRGKPAPTPEPTPTPEPKEPDSFSSWGLSVYRSSIVGMDETYSTNQGIWWLRYDWTVPGSGWLQFKLSLDGGIGGIGTNSMMLLLDIAPSLLWNFIDTTYFSLGIGGDYHFELGRFQVTDNDSLIGTTYAYPFSQHGIGLFTEAGVRMGRSFRLKAHAGLVWGLGFKLGKDADSYASGAYTASRSDGTIINVPGAFNQIKNGFTHADFGITCDFLMD